MHKEWSKKNVVVELEVNLIFFTDSIVVKFHDVSKTFSIMFEYFKWTTDNVWLSSNICFKYLKSAKFWSEASNVAFALAIVIASLSIFLTWKSICF